MLAGHANKGGGQGEDDYQDSGCRNTVVRRFFAFGSVHVGYQGGRQDEAKHGAYGSADHTLNIGVVHP